MNREKSASLAALLSFIFPGLGQAYLGNRRMAVVFASPVLLALVLLGIVVFSQGGIARAGARIFDPAVAFPAALIVILLGLWWITSIIHAWRSAGTGSLAPLAIALALIFVVGTIDAYAAMSLYRVGNAGIEISSRDPLDEANNPFTNQTPRPTPTPTTPGQTADPQSTPTQPPPDIDYPEDNPTEEPEPSIEPGPTPGFDIGAIDASNDGYLNVMLAGIDWIEGRVGARTDTILVVSVNNATGEVLMFSVPRDLQRFPIYNGGTFSGKINTFAGVSKLYPDQFPDPGMPALANQIGFMLGIPIDYHASVNMSGFLDVIRTVGSVNVCNPRDINDDHLRFYLPAGRHTLNAEDALRFVRSRKGQSGGDFARAKRQQEVLSALRREMTKPQNLPRVPDIAEALAQVISTNYPPNQIDQLLALAEQVDDEPSQQWILKNPDWAEIQRRAETGRRTALVPRMDRLAELSRQVFGEASLYWNGSAPTGTEAPSEAGPSPVASASEAADNPC